MVNHLQRGPRLETLATLIAIPEVARGGAARLLNLSTGGACVELDAPVVPGQRLEVKLAHPKLGTVPSLSGEVVWQSQTVEQKTRAGLRFEETARSDAAVRPFLTAEAGSCLMREGTLVGFVVPHGKAKQTWSVFEASGKRRAVASRTEAGYQVKAAASRPSFHAASLHEATCAALGVEDPLRLEPPVSDWRRAVGPTVERREARGEDQPREPNGLGRPASALETSSTADLEHPPVFVTSRAKPQREASSPEVAPEEQSPQQRALPGRRRGPLLLGGLALLVIAAYLVQALRLLVSTYTN